MGRSDTLDLSFDLRKDSSHIEIPTQASTRLDIISIESEGKVVSPENYEFFLRSAPGESPYSE